MTRATLSVEGPASSSPFGLVRALSEYHLYYPSRQQPSPAFSLLVEALLKAVKSCTEHHDRCRGRRELSSFATLFAFSNSRATNWPRSFKRTEAGTKLNELFDNGRTGPGKSFVGILDR